MMRWLLVLMLLWWGVCGFAAASSRDEIDDLNFPFYETTIAELQDKILRREVSCEETIHTFIERILAYDLSAKQQIPFNSIQTLNSHAIKDASELDNYYNDHRRLKGPLHCIPIVVKDNIDTFDMETSGGSFSLLGNQPIKDAYVVEKLREAGAIIIAKSTLDEFVLGYYGVSTRHGRTGNAYDVHKTAGGSSSGSGVAVSMNFTVAALGSDNNGSVRIPAVFNGVYGLRPTSTLVSQRGVLPFSYLNGVVGPMARNPTDLAKLLEVISEPDRENNLNHMPQREKPNYLRFMTRDAIRGKRIGILRSASGISIFPPSRTTLGKKYANLIKRLQGLGAIMLDNLELKDFDNERRDMLAGEIEAIDAYLGSFPSARVNMEDICRSKRTLLGGNVNDCLKYIKLVPNKDSSTYLDAQNRIEKNRNLVEHLMKEHKLDAILLPIGTAADPTSLVDVMTVGIASNAGLPALSFLTGYLIDDLPVGMQFIGKSFDEKTLLALAYDYDLHFNPRHSPQLNIKPFVSPLTIETFNRMKTLLGSFSLKSFLSEHKPEELNSREFKRIYQSFMDYCANDLKII